MSEQEKDNQPNNTKPIDEEDLNELNQNQDDIENELVQFENDNNSEWNTVGEDNADYENIIEININDPDCEEKLAAMINELNEKQDNSEATEGTNMIEEDAYEEIRPEAVIDRFNGHDEAVMCLAIDPRQNGHFTTGGLDDRAILWDINKACSDSENQSLLTYDMKETVSLVNYNHDGSLIAFGCLDETIKIFDTGTGILVKDIITPTGEISSLEFHPKGNAVLSSFKDGSVVLYSGKTGKELAQFYGHSAEVYGAYFTPDSKSIVTIGGDKTLRKWNPQDSSEIGKLDGYKFHSDSVTSLSFHPTNLNI